jgi:hypothetical protein
MTKAKIALVVAPAMFVAPSAMAQSRTHHAHITHSRVIQSYTGSDQWLRNAGYAGPVHSVSPNTGFYFVPSQRVTYDSCDLPSSGCSNDERINN